MKIINSMPTPSYYFSKNIIINNYKRYKQIYSKCHICYAMKANGEAPIVDILSKHADGIEVSNYDEFMIALKNGFMVNKIICSAPVKSVSDIKNMYMLGCRYFVFDSLSEYKKLKLYASKCLKIMRIDITDISNDSIEFGLPYHEISYYKPNGITIHMPSRSVEIVNMVFSRIDKSLSLHSANNQTKEPRENFYINLGGGYSINDTNEEITCINKWIEYLDYKYSFLNICWIMEPGNGIVQSSGYFACKVECVKKKDNLVYVYVDGGIPEGIQIKHGSITNISQCEKTEKRNIYVFFDTTCLHQRLFIDASKMKIVEGDILIMSECGGYTTCYINCFHNKKRPYIVVTDDIEL